MSPFCMTREDYGLGWVHPCGCHRLGPHAYGHQPGCLYGEIPRQDLRTVRERRSIHPRDWPELAFKIYVTVGILLFIVAASVDAIAHLNGDLTQNGHHLREPTRTLVLVFAVGPVSLLITAWLCAFLGWAFYRMWRPTEEDDLSQI